MTRLKKLRKLEGKRIDTRIKTASASMDLDYEILGSGDVIGLNARVVNWKPWYQVYLEYGEGSSSFYDGPDVNSACRMYSDLLTAFRGVSRAEKFAKQIPLYRQQLEQFISNPRNRGNDGYYYNLLLKRPSFLGFPQ